MADQIGEVQRIPSDTARGIRVGASTTSSSCSGLVHSPTSVEAISCPGAELQAEGHSAGFGELDVTSLDSVRAFADAAQARYGRIDVLVNDAGVMPLPQWTRCGSRSGTG